MPSNSLLLSSAFRNPLSVLTAARKGKVLHTWAFVMGRTALYTSYSPPPSSPLSKEEKKTISNGKYLYTRHAYKTATWNGEAARTFYILLDLLSLVLWTKMTIMFVLVMLMLAQPLPHSLVRYKESRWEIGERSLGPIHKFRYQMRWFRFCLLSCTRVKARRRSIISPYYYAILCKDVAGPSRGTPRCIAW